MHNNASRCTKLVFKAADEHLIDVVKETLPATSPEIFGTAVRTLTEDANVGTKGMAPPEESGGELREGEGQCQGPSPVDDSHASHPLVNFYQC